MDITVDKPWRDCRFRRAPIIHCWWPTLILFLTFAVDTSCAVYLPSSQAYYWGFSEPGFIEIGEELSLWRQFLGWSTIWQVQETGSTYPTSWEVEDLFRWNCVGILLVPAVQIWSESDRWLLSCEFLGVDSRPLGDLSGAAYCEDIGGSI